MVSVYCEKISPRTQYIFQHILGEIGGLEWEFEQDADEYKAHTGGRLNYSDKDDLPGFQVSPSGFLFESGVRDFDPVIKGEKDNLELFPVESGDFAFDVFSAVFYCLSRYEEYLPHRRDQHNRFEPSESWAFKAGVLQIPIADHWINDFLTKLAKAENLSKKSHQFQFTATIDVDSCYIYKDKGLMRALGALLRSLGTGDIQGFKDRVAVMLGREKDPHDTFNYLNKFHHDRNIPLIYFFLVADYGFNDKNVSLSKRSFQELIKGADDYASVGLHPSYASFSQPAKLKREVERLQQVVHRTIRQSRQHFLRIRLPETYRRLQEIGIADEHTMGYPSALGFRASTSRSFLFYDLDQERSSKLRAHPFALMEATLKYYEQITPEQAMQHFKPIIDAVKAVNGHLITVWHSEALSDYGPWKGWKSTYEAMVNYIQPNAVEA